METEETLNFKVDALNDGLYLLTNGVLFPLTTADPHRGVGLGRKDAPQGRMGNSGVPDLGEQRAGRHPAGRCGELHLRSVCECNEQSII